MGQFFSRGCLGSDERAQQFSSIEQSCSRSSTGSDQRRQQYSTMGQFFSRICLGSDERAQQFSSIEQSCSTSSTGSDQRGMANPEEIWMLFIDEHYPKLLMQANFFPPLQFNRVPHAVEEIAGERVLVMENPPLKPRPYGYPQPQNPRMPWMLYPPNPQDIQKFHVPDSDQQDDRAVQSCLSAISQMPTEEVMMVLSGLKFQKYLSNFTSPLYAAALNQLPTIQDPSLPQRIQDGECDIIIIHRHYGLLLGEIKSVGGSSHFPQQLPSEQARILRSTLIKETQKGAKGKGEEGAIGKGEEGAIGKGEEGAIGKGEEGEEGAKGKGEEGAIGKGEEGAKGKGEEGAKGKGEEGAIGKGKKRAIGKGEEGAKGKGKKRAKRKGEEGAIGKGEEGAIGKGEEGAIGKGEKGVKRKGEEGAKRKGALVQLQNQETGLRHLVRDLPPIRISKTLMLPNIKSQQLRTILQNDPSLLQELCQTCSIPQDVEQAVRHCLCTEDLENPAGWWEDLCTDEPDPCMTEDIFKRLVARFCGPATTVEIPTAGKAGTVLRSQGQAVAEAGLRFSALALTPSQVGLLNKEQEPQYLYLNGPPGTGKTICLYLKALQWVRQGKQVVLVSGRNESRAVTLLLKEQLCSMVEPAAAANIHHHSFDIIDTSSDAGTAVRILRQQCGQGPFLLIYDEFFYGRYDRDRDIKWLRELHAVLPAVTVWMAGIDNVDTPLTPPQPLPPWVEVQTLQESLRCPPTVTAFLQQSPYIQVYNDTLPYTPPQHPVATQGPPVKVMQHTGQPGHSGGHPWWCDRCADDVIGILTTQLRVGQPGHGLQYRDVFILYTGDVPRADDVMVQRLQRHGLPVRVVTSRPLSEDDTRELALAVSDVIMVADSGHVQGLERRVVISLHTVGNVGSDFLLPAPSRCCSALYYID